MNKLALIIFIKNPENGKVKTRLAKDIGDAGALQVYKNLLDYTKKITLDLRCDKLLFYSDFIDEHDGWSPLIYAKHLQRGKDLGDRMYNAFCDAFLTHKAVIIIGSDCIELTTKILKDGIAALQSHDVIIGPALDGGYYLIGMRTMHPEFFSNKQWSTSTVFKDTLQDVRRLKLTYKVLPVLSDIDTREDLTKSPFRFQLELNNNY